MRFLSDENIANDVVHALRNAGHDIFDIKEEGLYGTSDQQLIQLAFKQRRIILTHDKDFQYQRKVSAVILRFSNQRPDHVARTVLTFLGFRSVVQKLCLTTIIILSDFGAEIHRSK